MGKWQQFLYGGVNWTPCDRPVIFRRYGHNGLKAYDYECVYGLAVLTWEGGGQNLEQPIFRKFETSNIEITKVGLFDFSAIELILYFYDCLNYSNTQNTYLIIHHQIRNFLNFDSFTNCQIKKIC